MKALVLRENATDTAKCATALIDKGFQVACVETRKMARALIQLDTIDLLVMDEQVNGQLTHALALSAERRNPYVSAIIFTDRTGPDMDELYDLIPCLYGLVGSNISGRLIGQLALSSTENFEEAQARVQRLAQWAGPDDTHLDDATLDAAMAAEDAAIDPLDDDATDTCNIEPAQDQAVVSAETGGPLILSDFDAVKFASLTAAHSYMLSGPDARANSASARFAAAS